MTFTSVFDLSSLNGTNGFIINGINSYDFSGYSVSDAGDINGDGIDDLIISAANATANGKSNAGQSYVIFGSDGGFNASFDLNSLDGSNGFVINGINEYDNLGRSVSSAGDVNGDGINDLIIGAPLATANSNNGAGQSYIIFGSNGGFNDSFDLNSLDGTNGFVINGINEFDLSGYSVSSAGDVNGDGIDDLIIGTRNADFGYKNGAGQSYVVFGKDGGFNDSFDLNSLDGNNGFAINGINDYDYSGWAVSNGGDVNGDGFDDLIIAARFADPNGINNAGQSYVVFGKDGGFNASFDLNSLDGNNGFAINGINNSDISGFSVSSAGDINGDGIYDLIIGAPYADPNNRSGAGQSYVVFGKNGGFQPSLDPSSLDGSNGFVINGINSENRSGFSVSGAGDVNGDGIDDLIISAIAADFNGRFKIGQSYVVFGSKNSFSSSFELSSLNGSNGFILNGINSGDYSGNAVSGAGDINGDGIDDLIIGARNVDFNNYITSNAGQTYIVFGQRTLPILSINNIAVIEGQETNAVLTVSLNIPFSQSVSFDYTITPVNATANVDYTSQTGTITLAPNITTGTISILIIDDNLRESEEAFLVTLANPVNANLGDNFVGEVTISDTLSSSITRTLANEIENLRLIGINPINGTGNTNNNRITGNSANNILEGLTGNDILNGGAGIDTLIGGLGNDVYIVNTTTDTITELASQGTDKIQSSVNYSLASLVDIENLTLTGTSVINGIGNIRGNRIKGNSANNILNGGAGNDNLTGNAGNDTLTGGTNNDRFNFVSSSAFVDSNFGLDTISDFVVNRDKIVLSKTTFAALTSGIGNSFSQASDFSVVANDSLVAASNAFIVYSSGTGRLFYNQNGSAAGLGTGANFAILSRNPILNSNSFVIVA
jgi:Ca2+-binding RTX toxin-like protein